MSEGEGFVDRTLNLKIKRRSNVIGIFPNEAVDIRLPGRLLEQTEEWVACRHYMTLQRVVS